MDTPPSNWSHVRPVPDELMILDANEGVIATVVGELEDPDRQEFIEWLITVIPEFRP